jgi:DNA-binding NarL/FixJ family response regulator
MKIKIGIVDDHQLFLKSLALMLQSFNNYDVVIEASNGKNLQEKIEEKKSIPEIMLIDVNMPVMDGIVTATWLKTNYPEIKLVALSQNDGERAIISMLKAGCCAYLLKDTHPDELERALNEIYTKGFYNGDASNINFRRFLQMEKDLISMTEKEKKFLQLACSDMTYREIAVILHVSERTVEGYRESLFQKFNVQSRLGLVLEAIRRELITL